ncbi:Uncharacterised protein family (UPF0180) [Clostridium collagenovorans DSM 3089]|uniref:Uncharacterized protein family (UPF0180) n=1 Tax=Clostridium collagenovorans DSM 3089 TaxID=1121306 RepID=A0A1M5WK76_9CLOT|nr:YkuS family protein [Clostridium collagenovorans]SHH87847.1 Uncharacterised protein family (UPF0180) [Clostridium collagenovorans DSM 3089]
MKKVGVEQCLSPVKDLLNKSGYSVSEIKNPNNKGCCQNFDAVVLTGQSINMLGITDATTDAVVINADGMEPSQVKQQVEENIGR